MDLSTKYMGLELKNPLVASASPLTEKLDNFKKLEDAGIAGIVMHSVFEEQLKKEAEELNKHMTEGTESFAESLTYAPDLPDFVIGPETYLENIRKAKKTIGIPIIGSLNGYTAGGWIKYAKQIEEAGADALELNIYFVAADFEASSIQVENTYVEILKLVKSSVNIPVAVKLNPYFSSFANMARLLDEVGVDGLVLFNRFYQPDIDLEHLAVTPNLVLSSSHEMRLPLRWTAILYGNIKASLAATSGIHSAQDVLKMLMAGADVTMICSVLLKHGVVEVKNILQGMGQWMEEHEYKSIKQLKGSMSQKACKNPKEFERANYMKVLKSYQ